MTAYEAIDKIHEALGALLREDPSGRCYPPVYDAIREYGDARAAEVEYKRQVLKDAVKEFFDAEAYLIDRQDVLPDNPTRGSLAYDILDSAGIEISKARTKLQALLDLK